MKNSFGSSVILTLFGESHGIGIGAVLDGLAPGITVDEDFIRSQLSLRRPVGDISTPRAEPDNFVIESGVFGGKTTGTPICIVIPNVNTRSKDYSELRSKARPGHADYAAYTKYHGFEDYRGGGHFSGRITAGIVAAGAVAISALKNKGIYIGTHIKSIAGVTDREFRNIADDIKAVSQKEFAVLEDGVKEKMINEITAAKADGDSVGGVLETAVVGLPAGIGEPWFGGVENVLSSALFAVPAVKGVEFGAGFDFCRMYGSEANDAYEYRDGRVVTKTDNCGGVAGGMTTGMPVIFSVAMKPTPSIFVEQDTVDLNKKTDVKLTIKGRHDPCIALRAVPVVESAAAIAMADLILDSEGRKL